MKKHLFIIDPVASLNLELDSSLRLALALCQRGDQVFVAEPWNLFRKSSQGSTQANCQELKFTKENDVRSLNLGPIHPAQLLQFSSIHMRKDPPFDLDYIATTWMLDAVADTVPVLNSPSGIRTVNEKLSILDFPEFSAVGLVSANASQIEAFIMEECGGDAVIKPLTLFGGKGIERIQIESNNVKSRTSAKEKLRTITANHKSLRLVQPFDARIFAGEVRAFTLDGVPLSWCLKKPVAGQFLANSNFGSTRHQYQPTKNEVAAVTKVGQKLREEFGVRVIGFDLIAGNISEINITSPRLLQASDDHRDYYLDFAKWVQEVSV